MKILLVDDQDIYRIGLHFFLRDIYPDAEIVETDDHVFAADLLNSDKTISMVFYDLNVRGSKGLEGLRKIRQSYSNILVVVLPFFNFDEDVEEIFNSGVNGVISKGVSKKDLIQAMRLLESGRSPVVRNTLKRRDYAFSPRQTETLKLLLRGKSNKDIATQMSISHVTVREHVSRIIKTLKAENRTHAALLAVKHGVCIDC